MFHHIVSIKINITSSPKKNCTFLLHKCLKIHQSDYIFMTKKFHLRNNGNSLIDEPLHPKEQITTLNVHVNKTFEFNLNMVKELLSSFSSRVSTWNSNMVAPCDLKT